MGIFKRRKKTDNYTGSSEHLKQGLDLDKMINIRLKIFILILVAIAVGLVFRLYKIQIVGQSHYEDLLAKYSSPPVRMPTMRGEFLDSKGRIIVSNKAVNSITYYPSKMPEGMKEEEVALKFAKQFEVKDELNEDDLKVLWLRKNNLGESLLTEEDRKTIKETEMDQSAVEALKKSRITKEMTDTLSKDDRLAFQVQVKMGNIQMGQPSIILEEATNEQISYLAEHAAEFPGFSRTTSWKREPNKEVDLMSLIGDLGDVPYEKRDYYVAEGYELSEQVGAYGLEYQYEKFLSGYNSEYERTSGSKFKLQKDGRKGNDIRLTIDMDLQKEMEKIVKERLDYQKSIGERTKINNQIHVVATDPQTGDILGIVAMVRGKDGKYYNDPQLTMLQGYPVGSTIKGATVYMGLDTGVMKPGETVNDTPMYIEGTPPRHSWRNLGIVDDQTSLQHSSNIYMFNVAIRLGGSSYVPNGPLVFTDAEKTFAQMRNYYSQFGLGVRTQVDYPREEIGYKGGTTNSGSLLEFAIGQFDNYNAMQLSQYITIVANGGYRLQPHFVKEALNHDTHRPVYQNNVNILNSLDNKEMLERVRSGMRLCASSNMCGDLIATVPYSAAAKTGTAQAYDPEIGSYINNTYVAFAPYEQPKIAVACIAPLAYTEDLSNPVTNICTSTGDRIVDAYMNLK
ncbi:penicillin-binding protein 2 [Erysipelothrix enhydrae]|uniref:peptidoglycan D,D-transpeptidase FtsI family protein n=1 Tax=Erysipelothrix enhydrae TaxID=2890314 RepID=UPI002B24DFDA|nr:penicillin-binding protein 2 [Erysipelothrix sp. 4322-04]WRB86925.1 penicillin-binding protein 2 [Erysipelothrix sp. 4322-04]